MHFTLVSIGILIIRLQHVRSSLIPCEDDATCAREAPTPQDPQKSPYVCKLQGCGCGHGYLEITNDTEYNTMRIRCTGYHDKIDLARLPGTTCAASSKFSDKFGCEKAIDGSIESCDFQSWAISGNFTATSRPWVEIVLPSPHHVFSVGLVQRSQGTAQNKDVLIECGDNKQQTELVQSAADCRPLYQQFDLSPPMLCTTVKVTITSVYSPINNGFTEIALWGVENPSCRTDAECPPTSSCRPVTPGSTIKVCTCLPGALQVYGGESHDHHPLVCSDDSRLMNVAALQGTTCNASSTAKPSGGLSYGCHKAIDGVLESCGQATSWSLDGAFDQYNDNWLDILLPEVFNISKIGFVQRHQSEVTLPRSECSCDQPRYTEVQLNASLQTNKVRLTIMETYFYPPKNVGFNEVLLWGSRTVEPGPPKPGKLTPGTIAAVVVAVVSAAVGFVLLLVWHDRRQRRQHAAPFSADGHSEDEPINYTS